MISETPSSLSKGSKILNVMIFVFLAMLIAIMGLVIFWLSYSYKTADIVEPIGILNPNNQISPGDTISMELRISKSTSKKSPSLPPGTYTRIVDTYKLPNDASVGSVCTFKFRNSYQVNPIRSIIKEWSSEPFTVVK